MKLQKFHSEIIPFNATRVDRENAEIVGTVAMQVGMAQGHGFYADMTTLQTMAVLGNARRNGEVLMRFGHPGMSENAMGKKLSKATNFRVEGNRLLHDVKFMQSARKSPVFQQDPVEYLLDRAESDGDSFGESVVISQNLAWKLTDGTEYLMYAEDEDGDIVRRRRPENAVDNKLYMRPEQFHFVDFVGDGALTPNGLFSAEGDMWQALFADTSGEYTLEIFSILSEASDKYNLDPFQLKEKATNIVNKWIIWNEETMSDTPNTELEPKNVLETPAVDAQEDSPEADELTALMGEMAELAGDVEETDSDDDPETVEFDVTSFVSRAEFEQVQQENVALKAQFVEMRQQLAGYMKHVNSVVANLKAEVNAINQEEIGTASVGAVSQQFAALSGVSPQPPQKLANQKPAHVSQKLVNKLGEKLDPMAIDDDFDRALAFQEM